MSNTIKLTQKQSDILIHRLEVPDAIAEALDVTDDDQHVESSCVILKALAIMHRMPRVIKPDTTIGQVLSDAVAGSVMYALTESEHEDGEMTAADFQAYTQAGDALAMMVSQVTGIETVYPHY